MRFRKLTTIAMTAVVFITTTSMVISTPAFNHKMLEVTTLDNKVETTTDVNKTSTKTKKTITKTVIEEENTREIQLPANTRNSYKSYMDYRTTTDHSSIDWKLTGDGGGAVTDPETGVRMRGEYYCVAMGSGISTKKGSKFIVTLSNGKTIKVMLTVCKADAHTDSASHKCCILTNGRINIIEFIVDESKLPTLARTMGNLNYIPQFEGKIISIKQIK